MKKLNKVELNNVQGGWTQTYQRVCCMNWIKP